MEIIIGTIVGIIMGWFIGRYFDMRKQIKDYQNRIKNLATSSKTLKDEVNALTERVAVLEMGIDEEELEGRRVKLCSEWK